MTLTVDYLEALEDKLVIQKATELTNYQYNEAAADEAALLYYNLFKDLCSLKLTDNSPVVSINSFIEEGCEKWADLYKKHLMKQGYIKRIRFIMKKNPEEGIKKINLDLYKLRFLLKAFDNQGKVVPHEDISELLNTWSEYYPPIKSIIGTHFKQDEILQAV